MINHSIAHVKQNNEGTWKTHPLQDHLDATAKRAGEFAAEKNTERAVWREAG
jgi:hypothetical protein